MLEKVFSGTRGSMWWWWLAGKWPENCWRSRQNLPQWQGRWATQVGRGEGFERKFKGLTCSIKTIHELGFVIYFASCQLA